MTRLKSLLAKIKLKLTSSCCSGELQLGVDAEGDNTKKKEKVIEKFDDEKYYKHSLV